MLSPASTAAAPVDAGVAQARLETAVTLARRQVLMRRVLPLAGLAAVAVAAAGVGFSRDVSPLAPAAPVARLLLATARGPGARHVRADHGVVAQWQRAGLPHGGAVADAPSLGLRDGASRRRRIWGRTSSPPPSRRTAGGLPFYAASEQSVKRISIQGGAALRVCDSQAVSLDWDASGILVARGSGGVIRCNPAGGPPEQLVKVEAGETVPQRLRYCLEETHCCSRSRV